MANRKHTPPSTDCTVDLRRRTRVSLPGAQSPRWPARWWRLSTVQSSESMPLATKTPVRHERGLAHHQVHFVNRAAEWYIACRKREGMDASHSCEAPCEGGHMRCAVPNDNWAVLRGAYRGCGSSADIPPPWPPSQRLRPTPNAAHGYWSMQLSPPASPMHPSSSPTASPVLPDQPMASPGSQGCTLDPVGPSMQVPGPRT